MKENKYTQAFPGPDAWGLTKLEYAAIHIFAACCAGGEHNIPSKKWVIDQANELFDELDKE